MFAIRSGRSAQGARAAQSHTGAIAGEGRVWNGLFAQTGVIELDSLTQMIDAARLVQTEPRRIRGNPLLMSISGGAGSMMVDAIDAMVRHLKRSGKPIVVAWLAATPETRSAMSMAGIPCYSDIPHNALTGPQLSPCKTSLAALEKGAHGFLGVVILRQGGRHFLLKAITVTQAHLFNSIDRKFRKPNRNGALAGDLCRDRQSGRH